MGCAVERFSLSRLYYPGGLKPKKKYTRSRQRQAFKVGRIKSLTFEALSKLPEWRGALFVRTTHKQRPVMWITRGTLRAIIYLDVKP